MSAAVVQVDRDDSFCFGCDSAADVRNIEIQSDAIDVGEDRFLRLRADGAAVGTNVSVGISTSSRRVNLHARRARISASVPLATPMPCATLQNAESSFSSAAPPGQNKLLPTRDTFDGGTHFRANRRVLAAQLKLVMDPCSDGRDG